jgi:NADPH:quinone reductase-like Zn-dependent oxidoreductase
MPAVPTLPHLPRQVEVIDNNPAHPLGERLLVRAVTRAPLDAGQVRVGMLAMAVNPADLLQLDGRYGLRPPLPYVAGLEGVGVVLETAPDVSDLAPGARVLPLAAGGFWADERVLHRRALVPLDAATDALQQAMLCANPATAWVLLRHMAALQPGDWVLQNAANSAVGQCVRQLAPALGLRVLNIVRRAGAVPPEAAGDPAWVVDPEADAAALKAGLSRARGSAAPGRAALALDALGGRATGALAAALDDGGTVVVYGLMSGEPSALPAHDLVFRGFWLARWFADPANRTHAKGLYPALAAQLAAGALRVSVGAVHDLADAAAAVQAAAQPARAGKVLLRGAWWDRPL